MAWVFRDGKLLMKDGKAVVNENCCCGTCVEDCDDSSISVTLPALTVPGGGDCPDCADVPAGPYTLDSATAPEAYAGCCYWEKTSGFTETSDCTITKIWVVLCIADGDAVLHVQVEYAGGVIHYFTKTYAVCDFCDLVPGAVDVDSAATGECETAGVASVVFATDCCYQECICSCTNAGTELTLNWITQPSDTTVPVPSSPFVLTYIGDGGFSGDSIYFYEEEMTLDGATFVVQVTLSCHKGDNTLAGCPGMPSCKWELSILASCYEYPYGTAILSDIVCSPLAFPITFSGTVDSSQCGGIDWEAEIS